MAGATRAAAKARGARAPARAWARRRAGRTQALDAAMPFDTEARASEAQRAARKLRVGVVGFGNFGQFLARRIIQQGHDVIGFSRSDHAGVAEEMGCLAYFRDADDFCESHPDVVVLCTSIISTESVLENLPMQRLRRSTLIVDVLSVKSFPRDVLLRRVPDSFDILCTHPMFGPDSGAGRWDGLTFMYDPVRVLPDSQKTNGGKLSRSDRLRAFLDIFKDEGCRMVEMTCADHDRRAASSQFITHTIGRVLGEMDLSDTSINTKGYESLLKLVENTANDSFELYYGLFLYNDNAIDELHRLESAFDEIKQKLFSQLHERVRTELLQSSRAVAPARASGASNGASEPAREGAAS